MWQAYTVNYLLTAGRAGDTSGGMGFSTARLSAAGEIQRLDEVWQLADRVFGAWSREDAPAKTPRAECSRRNNISVCFLPVKPPSCRAQTLPRNDGQRKVLSGARHGSISDWITNTSYHVSYKTRRLLALEVAQRRQQTMRIQRVWRLGVGWATRGAEGGVEARRGWGALRQI